MKLPPPTSSGHATYATYVTNDCINIPAINSWTTASPQNQLPYYSIAYLQLVPLCFSCRRILDMSTEQFIVRKGFCYCNKGCVKNGKIKEVEAKLDR